MDKTLDDEYYIYCSTGMIISKRNNKPVGYSHKGYIRFDDRNDGGKPKLVHRVI